MDFEKLKQVLGNYVEDSNERYNFTWNGKGGKLSAYLKHLHWEPLGPARKKVKTGIPQRTFT